MGTDDERGEKLRRRPEGGSWPQLPVEIARKASHAQDDFESAESLRNMDLCLVSSPGLDPGVSAYLRIWVEAEKPRSYALCRVLRGGISEDVIGYTPFKKTLLRGKLVSTYQNSGCTT